MPAPRPSSPVPAARLAEPVERPETYVRFVDISDDLTDAALASPGARVNGHGPSEWAPRAARTIVDGVGAALLAGDPQVFVDHLGSEAGRVAPGVADVQFIG